MKNFEREKRGIGVILLWGLILVYGVSCFYLYYMQSIQPLDYNNRVFQSDLPYHISMIVDDGWYYSFTAYVYQLLYHMEGGGTVLICLFLALVTVGSVWATNRLLVTLLAKQRTDVQTLGGALLLNMVMPFFWKVAGQYRYVSYQSGNIWHNSTYLCMRLLAILAILCYYSIEKEYREKIRWKSWTEFAVILVVTTGVKPSFLTVFAPAMALKLLWDLLHGVSFKQVFLFGCSVLPACGVVLWQNMVLFGEDTGQGFAWNPWFTFSLHADRPKLAVLCSIAFPLVVLVFSLKELLTDKTYFFAWLMTGIGFMEALLLAETGSRANDGNFLWGYSFAIFYVFVLSFVKWLALWNREQATKTARVLFVLAGVVLWYQTYCGVYFFRCLLEGKTYFM